MSKYLVAHRKPVPYNLSNGDVVLAQPGRPLLIPDDCDNSTQIQRDVCCKPPLLVREKTEEEKAEEAKKKGKTKAKVPNKPKVAAEEAPKKTEAVEKESAGEDAKDENVTKPKKVAFPKKKPR